MGDARVDLGIALHVLRICDITGKVAEWPWAFYWVADSSVSKVWLDWMGAVAGYLIVSI